MHRVFITRGDYKGLEGDATYLPQAKRYVVSIPSSKNAQIKEDLPPENLKILRGRRPPILDKKEFITLQHQVAEKKVIACKCSCSSSWCEKCFVAKGKSKAIASKLSKMNHKAVRLVVLTPDRKKFSGQDCYMTIRKKGALSQFIHNLERTSVIRVVNWLWVLEWYRDGFPHWHFFIETEEGKKGQIGNAALLKHWPYGLVREDFIHNDEHWQRYTSYFGAKGYFDPKSKSQGKDKTHQLTLPTWAKEAKGLRIRKYGAKVIQEAHDPETIDLFLARAKFLWLFTLTDDPLLKSLLGISFFNYLPDLIINNEIRQQLKTFESEERIAKYQKRLLFLYLHELHDNLSFKTQIATYLFQSLPKKRIRQEKTYGEILDACGQSTYCLVCSADGNQRWYLLHLPYRTYIRQQKGYFEPHVGYKSEMLSTDFQNLYCQYQFPRSLPERT